MVLLAAAICEKSGKALLSRQFIETSRHRIEALLVAFPKLVQNNDKQHTFVETESVRYVYQPMDKLYMLLITTKNSNILEDLETLRLFSRIIPEYCSSMDEDGVADKAFDLILAFDEVVALGYRESVNISQIRTYIEMDSHEEKMQLAIRETQEREAKEAAKRKAKELNQLRKDAAKAGKRYTGSGIGNNAIPDSRIENIPSTPMESTQSRSTYSPPASQRAPSKAMKLGVKSKDVDQFVNQLRSEGERVAVSPRVKPTAASEDSNKAAQQSFVEKVHFDAREKLTLEAGRDGGLNNMEIHGMLSVRISDAEYSKIQALLNYDKKFAQVQLHPNFDKQAFLSSNKITLRNPSEKPLPVGTDVSIVKWRYQTADEDNIPLLVSCWPSTSADGCDVIIEYELRNTNLVLENVVISIPIGGHAAPVVKDFTGTFSYKRGNLIWEIPLINADSVCGNINFTASCKADDFFPVAVDFTSSTLFLDLEVDDVNTPDGEEAKCSVNKQIDVVKYEVE